MIGHAWFHTQGFLYENCCCCFCCVGATVHCCGVFGQGEGEIILSQVNCVGTESSLFGCSMSSGSCSHLNDVGVTCEGIITR